MKKSDAAAELLARRRGRENLLDFTRYTLPSYEADGVHALIAATLDKVIAGKIRRLIITAPPQHGKSELASVRLPSMWLAKRPDDPVILTSYAATLAEDKSRQVRDTIKSAAFQNLFDVQLKPDVQSVQKWRLQDQRGGLQAAGVGGSVTGFGGMLGIIDDPHKDWAEAQSQVKRDAADDWYRNTFRTRIWEGGAIIMIATRWHEDDLIGRVLKRKPGEWEILRLPALAETQEARDKNNKLYFLPAGLPDPLGRKPGEALAPQRFSAAELQSLREDVGSLGWSAEYQGSPRTPEGNRIKREWLEIVNVVPTRAQRIRYWDKAATQDGGCFSAGVLLALTPDGTVYIEDIVRGQWSYLQRNRIMKQTAMLDKIKYGGTVNRVVIWIEQEPGSGGKESAEATIRDLKGHPVKADRPTGDKDVRLEPLITQAEAGNVKLLAAAWNEAFIDEAIAIPNGTYRDQTDAAGAAYNLLTSKQPLQSGRLDFYNQDKQNTPDPDVLPVRSQDEVAAMLDQYDTEDI